MSKRKPLKPGTKIKFVGPTFWNGVVGAWENEPRKAVVEEEMRCCSPRENPGTSVTISLNKGELYERKAFIHRRQVTHVLKPKAPPVKREEPIVRPPVEIYAAVFPDDCWYAYKRKDSAEDTAKSAIPNGEAIRLVECPDSSRVLSREELAEAEIECPDRIRRKIGGLHFFNDLCVSLGLEQP